MRPDYVGELIPFQEGVQGVRARKQNNKELGISYGLIWGQRKIAGKTCSVFHVKQIIWRMKQCPGECQKSYEIADNETTSIHVTRLLNSRCLSPGRRRENGVKLERKDESSWEDFYGHKVRVTGREFLLAVSHPAMQGVTTISHKYCRTLHFKIKVRVVYSRTPYHFLIPAPASGTSRKQQNSIMTNNTQLTKLQNTFSSRFHAKLYKAELLWVSMFI